MGLELNVLVARFSLGRGCRIGAPASYNQGRSDIPRAAM